MPQFVTLKTAAEAAVESKKATEQGMRDLASALKSGDYSDDEHGDSEANRYIHLELLNAKVDIADLNNELDGFKKQFEILNKINNELSQLSNLHYYTKDINSLCLKQAEKKLALYKEEEREHSLLCLSYSKHIEFPEIKKAVSLMITVQHKKNMSIEDTLVSAISHKWWVGQIEIWLFRLGLSIIVVLFAVLMAQKN